MKFSSTPIALGLSIFLATSPVSAQVADSDFRALLKDNKANEVEPLARARLLKNDKDDVALWYLARITAGDSSKREDLIPRLEQCVKDLPQSARCHHALGSVYGAAALASGMVGGIKYVGRIKASFLRAVELDPQNFDMRRDLNQFYLQAPGLVGGSVRKAIDNADAFAKLNPPGGQLLRAEVHVYEKEWAKAAALLDSIRLDNDEQVNVGIAWIALGGALLADKQAAQAQALFEKRLSADTGNATLHFWVGRAQLENGKIDAAINSLERALQLNDKLPAHYRLGIAYQTKGDKPKAITAFEKFLTYWNTGNAAEDVKKRLLRLQQNQ